jgi:hypothetical protein
MTTRANSKGLDVDLNSLPLIHSVHSLNFILPCTSAGYDIILRTVQGLRLDLYRKDVISLKTLVPKVDLRKKPLVISPTLCSETNS